MTKLELTPREQEILKDVLDGLSDDEIKAKRFIEKSTIKSHLAMLYYKHGVTSRSKLICKIYKKKIDNIKNALKDII